MSPAAPFGDALDRARRKAYLRLVPLCFICYVIAYVDRSNVAIAKLTMSKDLGFDNAVFGFGFGVFFIGYFLLEIPGSLLVERWSARKWISRIMITWGITAAATAFVTTPNQFYGVRFMLGLSEAGFYPGVIVYLTHWFTIRDRARALAYFFAATPAAQILSPKISNAILKIGTDEMVGGTLIHHPQLLGMVGWQWVYIFWGIPAVLLGVIVLFALTDRPRDARWLSEEERAALEAELEREKAAGQVSQKRHNLGEALRHPKVLALAAAYFLVVIGNYGMESFLPSILERWYSLKLDALTWLVLLPPTLALISQLLVGWSSDRSGERRMHTVVPIALGAIAMAAVPATRGNLTLTIICFMVAFAGLKAYLPAFWSLPNLFLSGSAAAGSIGLINSFGNLGGFIGPYVLGKLDVMTGSFEGGVYFMAVTMVLSAATLFLLGLGNKSPSP